LPQPNPERRRLFSRRRWPLVAAGAAIGAAVGFYAWQEARVESLDHRTIADPSIPPSFNGLRIVFFADVHAGPQFGRLRVRRLVEKVNEYRPDLVLLGGDYVGGWRFGARAFYSEIGCLSATHGVFAVLGNHDVWEGVDDARRGMAEAGITLLENETVRIEAPDGAIVLAGLEDLWTGLPDPTALAEQVGPDEFGVLVTHNPDVLAWALSEAPDAWDLALAGHTHGGQILGAHQLLPRKSTAHGRRYLGGWTEEHGTDVLVTHGIGTVTVPLRFGRPPQLHVIDLKRAKSACELKA
jgi:hypothetical protein